MLCDHKCDLCKAFVVPGNIVCTINGFAPFLANIEVTQCLLPKESVFLRWYLRGRLSLLFLFQVPTNQKLLFNVRLIFLRVHFRHRACAIKFVKCFRL